MIKLAVILSFLFVLAACASNTDKTVESRSSSVTDSTAKSPLPESTNTILDTEATIIPEKPMPAVEEKKATEPKKVIIAKTPVSGSMAGKQLLAKSDCLTCHKEQVKVIGPAYADVAKKYEPTPANISYLTDKVISGGSGVWGQIPMAPHPNLSKGDVTAMVNYILSIKSTEE